MVSQVFRESAYADETEDVWLVLAVISHPDLSASISVVNNNEAVVSNGVIYLACPFEPVLPDETGDSIPAARLRIEAVTQDVVAALRSLDTPPSVSFQVVLASDPDTIEAEYSGLQLRDVRINLSTIVGTLGLEDLRLEPFPSHSFSPSFFPGAF